MTDWFSRENAERLAKRIRDYWADRGHVIDTVVVPIHGIPKAGVYGVRSTLLNGLPSVRRTLPVKPSQLAA